MSELQCDRISKKKFLKSLNKGEYSDIKEFNLTNIGICDHDIELIFKAI